MVRAQRAPRYRYVIGGLIIWAHFAAGVNFQAVAPILPLISEDYGINYFFASLLIGMVMFIHGFCGIPGGILVGRLPVWRVYTICWFLMSILALSALSPTYAGLLSLRIVYALGMSGLVLASGPLLMEWFGPRDRPVITSLSVAAVSLGMVVAASTAAPLADEVGWERALGLFGFVSLAGALAWTIWGRTRKVEGDAGTSTSVTWREIKSVLRNRTVLLLGAADAACFSQYIALSAWLPTFYNEARGTSLTEAGFIVSLLPFMGIFAVLLGGYLPGKIGSRRLFFIVPGVMAGLGGLGSFLVDNTLVTYFSVAVLGLGSWLYIPSMLTLPMELPEMKPRHIPIAWGWVMTTSGLAAFISPLLVGGMRDSLDSFIPGFMVFAALAWTLVAVGLLLPELPRRAEAPELVGPTQSPEDNS